MNTPTPRMTLRKSLQIVGFVLLIASGAPCLFSLINISAVVHYALETGKNVALGPTILLLIAGMINGLGILLLGISLFVKD